MTSASARAIILAATRGVRRLDVEESTPSPLLETPQGRVILDRQIDAITRSGIEDIVCLAGYHIEKLVKSNADVSYYYEPDWQETGQVAGLKRYSELVEGDLIIATGEMLFEDEAIERLSQTDADIAVTVTRFPSRDAAREAGRTLDPSDLVSIDGGFIDSFFNENEVLPDARVLTLVHLTPRGAGELRSVLESLDEGSDMDDDSLIGLLARLKQGGANIRAVEVGESARRLDETHALARFLLGTKADTLERLRGLVDRSRILDQLVFEVASWERDPLSILDEVRSHSFRTVVVRSSSIAEDGWQDSQAGAFHTELGVDPTSTELAKAIENVAERLRKRSGRAERDQILIQPQVEDVMMSGVAFTRDLESAGPYTVINFDEVSGRTDTVTSGQGNDHRTVYLHHCLDGIGHLEEDESLSTVKDAIDELRELLGDPPLDIEFAVNGGGEVVILQVRPLAVHSSKDRFDERDVEAELRSTVRKVKDLNSSRPLLDGSGTVLGMMPDWNPAEMIGTDPNPLAVSLYRYLITDDVWARARAASGYRDVRPAPLMVTLAGRPFIDTLVDFNSFIPASLPDELGTRLVEHYVDRLRGDPTLHDKVEFEVAIPSLDFSFDRRVPQLENAGFTEHEIETIREHLLSLTDSIVRGETASMQEQCQKLLTLGRRRKELLEADRTSWSVDVRRVGGLLDDAREFGTLPFSILARYAFIATALLQSLVERGVITDDQLDRLQEGIPTIAHELSQDMERLREGSIDSGEFLVRYGHLRPGTYDIDSPRYDEVPANYFDISGEFPDIEPLEFDRTRESVVEGWSPEVSEEAEAIFDEARDGIFELIEEEGFTFTPEELFDFATHAIPLRELAKFEFTRNLSAALSLLRRSAEDEFHLDPDDLRYLSITQLLQSATENPSPVIDREFERAINHNEKRKRIQDMIPLPPLIRDCREIRAFEISAEQPNYVTDASVTAGVVRVDDIQSNGELQGRIALIPSADPGYDWIFGSGIAGLVTKYGGVASHMAIRAAEFGLPAAIGCGEILYDRIARADVVELDSGAGRLEVVR